MKYRKEYKMTFPYGDGKPHHLWSIVGAKGAKHLTIHSYGQADDVEFCGGLETHWRTPPEYMQDDAPSHDNCWLLGQPCWHDGTSLYVSERIIPYLEPALRSDKGLSMFEHDWVFRELEYEMKTTFENGDSD